MCKPIDEPKARPDVGCTELLDCPFCGLAGTTQPHEAGPGGSPQYTGCSSCDIWFEGDDSEEQWNNRQKSNASLTLSGGCSEPE